MDKPVKPPISNGKNGKRPSLEERILQLEKERQNVMRTEIANKEEDSAQSKRNSSDSKKKYPWHTTLYEIEYCHKKVKRTKPFKPIEEKEHEGNPIAEAYIDNLKANHELEKIEPKCLFDNGDCFYSKLLETKPSLIKVVESPVNQDVVYERHLDEGRSVYQLDYCKRLEKGDIKGSSILDSVKIRELEPLPESWLPVALTEYRSSYKSHIGIAPWKMSPDPIKPAKIEIVPTEKERELLDEGLGQTEYQDTISDLGSKVIQDKYFGTVKTLPYEVDPSTGIPKLNQEQK